VLQRDAAELDEAGQLLGRLQRARLGLQRLEGLLPGQHRAEQQQRQPGEGAPEKVQGELRSGHQADMRFGAERRAAPSRPGGS